MQAILAGAIRAHHKFFPGPILADSAPHFHDSPVRVGFCPAASFHGAFPFRSTQNSATINATLSEYSYSRKSRVQLNNFQEKVDCNRQKNAIYSKREILFAPREK